jgi:AsmA protein
VKLVLKILGVILALIFVAVVSLLLFFDPNMFKPRIEAMAREQGVALNIDGNLGWRLWPNLGVEVNGIRVAAVSAPEDQIAQLRRASLLLASIISLEMVMTALKLK